MYQIRLGNRMFLGLPDPAANRTCVACVAGEHSSKELFEQIVLLLFRTYNMAAPVHVAVTHGLIPGAQARM
jgi:hypothetical protein